MRTHTAGVILHQHEVVPTGSTSSRVLHHGDETLKGCAEDELVKNSLKHTTCVALSSHSSSSSSSSSLVLEMCRDRKYRDYYELPYQTM